MTCRRNRLRRRYGCFSLPRVPGAHVKEAARKDVSWLARTDPQAREIEFSGAWAAMPPEERAYIVLHERAHLKTGPNHDDRFYAALKRLIAKSRVSWETAYSLEQFNCHRSH
jgi:hypothetical protein